MKFSAIAVLGLTTSASAFSPVNHAVFSRTKQSEMSPVALEMADGEKRKAAMKVLRRTAGAFGAIALASTAVVPAAHAAKAVVDTVKAADDTKTVVAASVAGGVAVGAILTKVLGAGAPAPAPTPAFVPETATAAHGPTLQKIQQAFPNALPNKELVKKVAAKLRKYAYGPSSLIATSLCADEVNRVLEKDLSEVFGPNFSMGGLAGFPFGGVTSFGAMAAHIPDGGSCLVVFGPHVGIDTDGKVGTVERYGRKDGGPCCGSAIAAAGYVAKVAAGQAEKLGPPDAPIDAQQRFVTNMLLPHAARLEKAADKMVELPYALFDAQKVLIGQIIEAAASTVAGGGKIAVLGGIQINTPEGQSAYFQPLSFDVFDNTGTKLESIAL